MQRYLNCNYLTQDQKQCRTALCRGKNSHICPTQCRYSQPFQASMEATKILSGVDTVLHALSWKQWHREIDLNDFLNDIEDVSVLIVH